MTVIAPKRIKALTLDCMRPDSTLSGRMVSALRACMDRGIRAILCTGRSVEATESYRTALGAEGPWLIVLQLQSYQGSLAFSILSGSF